MRHYNANGTIDKWDRSEHKVIEYEVRNTHNGKVLVAGLILVGIIVWLIMNADVIKQAIY